MTGDMMSTQQDNANVASGHSFADQVKTFANNLVVLIGKIFCFILRTRLFDEKGMNRV